MTYFVQLMKGYGIDSDDSTAALDEWSANVAQYRNALAELDASYSTHAPHIYPMSPLQAHIHTLLGYPAHLPEGSVVTPRTET